VCVFTGPFLRDRFCDFFTKTPGHPDPCFQRGHFWAVILPEFAIFGNYLPFFDNVITIFANFSNYLPFLKKMFLTFDL
jgi:hypothetical protein